MDCLERPKAADSRGASPDVVDTSMPTTNRTSTPRRGILPPSLFDQPTSVFVYGDSRPLVNLTLYALATNTNPEFQWVEIRPKDVVPTSVDPFPLGWIPRDRVWIVDPPSDLRPNESGAHLPIFDMVRHDEPSEELHQLTDFLHLPDRSQTILARHAPLDRPGVVAVSNAQEVQAAFPSGLVPSILNIHRRAGFSVLVGWGTDASEGRSLFDYVFRLERPKSPADGWRDAVLVCEKGISRGPLAGQGPVRLTEIPQLARVLSNVTARSETG